MPGCCRKQSIPPLFPRSSNLYRRIYCYAKQAARLHGGLCSSGRKQVMPAQVSQLRPSAKPGPAQGSVGDGGCLAGCSRKQYIQPTVHRSISAVQEAIYVAVAPLFPGGRLIFSEAGSNLYRRNDCFDGQAARMRSSPFSSGWEQFLPVRLPRPRSSTEAVLLVPSLVRRKTASGMAVA